MVGWVVGWLGGWLGGWLENWRVMLISAFNYVIVEVVAEIGNILVGEYPPPPVLVKDQYISKFFFF